jgi:hypothetical protein
MKTYVYIDGFDLYYGATAAAQTNSLRCDHGSAVQIAQEGICGEPCC